MKIEHWNPLDLEVKGSIDLPTFPKEPSPRTLKNLKALAEFFNIQNDWNKTTTLAPQVRTINE